MRYVVVALLILTLAAPAVLAAKPSKGQALQPSKMPQKNQVQNEKVKGQTDDSQYQIVTLLGGKFSARVPITPTR